MEPRDLVNMVVLIAFAVILIVPVLLWAFYKVAPNPEFDLQSYPDRSEEMLSFKQWERAGHLAALVCIVAATGGWFCLLRVLARAVGVALPESRFLVLPGYHYWLLIALFLGLLSASLLVPFGMRIALRTNWPRFAAIQRKRSLWNDRKISRPFHVLFGTALLLAIATGLNTYATFYDDYLIINPPFSFRERRYRYEDIRRIYSVQCVENALGTRDNPHFAIEFGVGFCWTTRTNLRDPEPVADSAIFEWLSEKTKKPIESVETFD